MIRFCHHSGEPFILFMAKCERQKDSSTAQQTTLFSPSNEGHDPDLSQFCFPIDNIFNPEKNFVFYLKGGDNSDSTYGYVYYFDESDNKNVAYCLVSQFYDPKKAFDFLYNARNKPNIDINNLLSESIQVNANYLACEECAIQNDLFEFCCAFDLYDLGKLIVHMLLDCKIIISGNDIGRVSRSLFGLLSAIYPLPWPGVFIPILPQKMIDAVYAPFPYLVGIHDSMLNETENPDVESHILVDLVRKTISFGLEEFTLPSKVDKALNSFKKKIIASSLDKQVFQNSLRKLILKTVAIALNQPYENIEKIHSTWEDLKNHPDNPDHFSDMICQSQLVLQLMRIIEQGPEDDSYKCFFDSALASTSTSKRFSGHFKPFIKRKRTDSNPPMPTNVKQMKRPMSIAVFDKKVLATMVQTKNEKSTPPIQLDLTPPSTYQPPPKAVTPLVQPEIEQKAQSSESSIQQISNMAVQFAQRRSAIDQMLQQKKELESQKQQEAKIRNPEKVSFAQKIAMYNAPQPADRPPLKSVKSLPPSGLAKPTPKRANTMIVTSHS